MMTQANIMALLVVLLFANSRAVFALECHKCLSSFQRDCVNDVSDDKYSVTCTGYCDVTQSPTLTSRGCRDISKKRNKEKLPEGVPSNTTSYCYMSGNTENCLCNDSDRCNSKLFTYCKENDESSKVAAKAKTEGKGPTKSGDNSTDKATSRSSRVYPHVMLLTSFVVALYQICIY